jgi:hypothetical protein
MNAKPDLRLIGEQLDATAARQREVFADRYAEVKDGSAFDGMDAADLPEWHPDSINYQGDDHERE